MEIQETKYEQIFNKETDKILQAYYADMYLISKQIHDIFTDNYIEDDTVTELKDALFSYMRYDTFDAGYDVTFRKIAKQMYQLIFANKDEMKKDDFFTLIRLCKWLNYVLTPTIRNNAKNCKTLNEYNIFINNTYKTFKDQ